MLTEQNLTTETVSLAFDTLPLRFIISDDGRSLLAVTENEDGSLEITTAPVAFIQQSNTIASPSTKENTDEPQVIHINIENLVAATNNTEFDTIATENTEENDCVSVDQADQVQITEVLDTSDAPPSEDPKNLYLASSSKIPAKKGPGRPKKSENSTTSSEQKCEICGEEFKKQNLYKKHMDDHAAEKPHRCPKCPASFNVPANFTLHMATHSTTGETKCPECGKKFSRIASLKAHMLTHEKEENLFCTECEDTFSTKAQLDAHLKLHNEKWSTDDVRKCKLCNKQFTQPALYRLHIREHYRLQTKIMKQTKRGTRQKTIYKCKICNFKVFQKPSQLVRHLLVHTGEKPYKCTQCNGAFSQKSSLKIHMLQHIGVRPFSCEQCNAKFSQKGNLNAHILRVHSAIEGEPTYACTQCSCVFKKLGSLNGHMKKMHPMPSDELMNCDSSTENNNNSNSNQSHENSLSQLDPDDPSVIADSTDQNTQHNDTNNDILQQALENSGLSSKEKSSDLLSKKLDGQTSFVTLVDRSPDGSLRRYVTIKQRRVGGTRWYSCSFCHKEFKKPSDLFRHRRIHTLERPFKCTIAGCFRSFALKSTMKAHERTHCGIKKFSCGICNKMFSCHSSLTAHTRTHSKIHKCNICDLSFSTSTILKSHMKNHTKIKSQLSPEVERLVPQIVLEEPLLISDAGDKISVAQVQTKQRHVYDTDDTVGRPHKCWVCPAAFRKISHLKAHQRIHSGERPYKCPKCDRKFASNSVLKAHLNTHEESRPFSCSVCNATFSTSSSQKRHLVTHSNKRPFMCPYCHKTFKTSVNCRKHMKIHKNELAQQQLEKQKIIQSESEGAAMEKKETLSSSSSVALTGDLNLSDDIGVNFQSNITTDFAQAFSEQYQAITDASKNDEQHTINQNLDRVDADNLTTSQIRQTLHADETGTITLPNYTGDQTLTPENIREIEETLNQQLFNIGMNLGGLENNLSRQISDSENVIMETREQRDLNIIYDNQKDLDTNVQPVINQSIFGPPHFDTFDMSQIALQADTEIDMSISSANSTSMASILPRSAQEEQRFVPVTSCNNQQSSSSSNDLIPVTPMQTCPDGLTSPSTCQKYPKIIAKADTTDTIGLLGLNGDANFNKTSSISNQFVNDQSIDYLLDKKNNIPQQNETSEYFIDKETLLQCHMCCKKGFTAAGLKNHLKIHRGAKEFQCPECGLKCLTSSGLSRHYKSHTNKQTDTWVCSVCYKTLNNEEECKLHIESHNNPDWDSASIVEPDSSQKSPIHKLDTNFLSTNSTVVDSKIDHSKIIDGLVNDPGTKRGKNKNSNEGSEKAHKCNYADCSKSFRKPSDLIRHVRTHTGERPYQCEHCNKSFAVKCTLNSHMQVHAATKSFSCEVCNNQFATKGSLKVHLRLHTGLKPYKCTICDLKFRTSGHRKIHLVSHTREKNPKDNKKRKLKQNNNNDNNNTNNNSELLNDLIKIGETVNELNEEQKINDKIERQTVDDIVNETTNNLNTDDTLNTIINDVQVLNVSQQPSEFPNLDTIAIDTSGIINPDGSINNNSVLSVNDNNELVASLQFLLSTGLFTVTSDEAILPGLNVTDTNLNNEQTLVDNDTVEQVQCNNELVIKRQINNNLTENQNNQEEQRELQLNNNCMGLGEITDSSSSSSPASVPANFISSFSSSTVPSTIINLNQQSTTKLNGKNINNKILPKHACDICGKIFKKPYLLQRHRRIHTNERPYKCDLCEKSFSQKATLKIHGKHHTGDRPYKCTECDNSFTQKCNLQTHLKRVHELDTIDGKKFKRGQKLNCNTKLLQDDNCHFNDNRILTLDDISFVELLNK